MMVCRGILQRRHLYYDGVAAVPAALGAGTGVYLYNRIDQVLFGRLLVGGMLVGGLTYVAHGTTDLIFESKLLPGLHVDWLLELYAEAVEHSADALGG